MGPPLPDRLALLGRQQVVNLAGAACAQQRHLGLRLAGGFAQLLRLGFVEVRRICQIMQIVVGTALGLGRLAPRFALGAHQLAYLLALGRAQVEAGEHPRQVSVTAGAPAVMAIGGVSAGAVRVVVAVVLAAVPVRGSGEREGERQGAGQDPVGVSVAWVGHGESPVWVVRSIASHRVKLRSGRVKLGKDPSALLHRPLAACIVAAMTRVLLIDDDVELTGLLQEYLQRDGFEVAAVHDGAGGAEAALSGSHDIVVLDVMLPGLNGIETLRRIRATSRVPVLMLTARGDDVDRIVGLELGADDYVPKPCTPRELVARLRAILRRTQPVEAGGEGAQRLVNGPLALLPGNRSAEWHGQPLALTSAEFNLLEVLLRQAGRVVGKAELSERGLGRPLARYDRSIDVHVSSIRQKLGPRTDGLPWIRTVRGIGYQLVKD